MSTQDEPRLAWAIEQFTQSIENEHARREALCRAGHILRTSDGQRAFWKDTPPSDEEREAAKEALLSEPPFRAYCPCCDTTYGMASVFTDIQEHGVCGYCLPFVEGDRDGLVVKRAPTLDEALAVDANDIRQAETWAMRAALLAQRAQREAS